MQRRLFLFVKTLPSTRFLDLISLSLPRLQLVKMVQKIEDKEKQKAEIHSHYGRFDKAEKLYKEMDRKDLIVEMRMKIGDW